MHALLFQLIKWKELIICRLLSQFLNILVYFTRSMVKIEKLVTYIWQIALLKMIFELQVDFLFKIVRFLHQIYNMDYFLLLRFKIIILHYLKMVHKSLIIYLFSSCKLQLRQKPFLLPKNRHASSNLNMAHYYIIIF